MAAARLPDELGRIARDLYGVPPEAFTSARSDAVKQARSAGDKELARAVGALRRPALAAWAVNLLVREREGLLEQVTSMGDALRTAQAQLDGEALRDLTRQRRQLVAAVAVEVGAVAAAHDHPLSAAASRQVEETVQAALVDPRAAAAVRSGVLVSPLASTGVESLAEVLGVPLPEESSDAVPQESRRPELSVVTPDEETARQEALERAVAAENAARKAAKAAAKARDKALAGRAKAQARVLQVEAAVEELRGQLAEAEAAAEAASAKLATREAAAENAVAAADAAEREAERAATAVRRLSD